MPDTPAIAGTLLGFDFGKRRIGVAVGQTATRTAGPLEVVRHAEQPDWETIDRLVKEWRPVAMVVGLPLDAEGNDSDMSREARRFGERLAERSGKPVLYIDERLSSKAAEADFASRRASGRARKKDAGKLDAVAAKIILENWLQSQPH